MNTMEDNQNIETNDFKPTRELGDLVLFAAGKAFGANKMWASIKKFTHFDDSTIWEIIDGTWKVKNDYIRLLSLCISRIRPKKVKLKKLPNTLPNRDVIESLEKGIEEDLSLYEKAITVLCMMPDLPPKKHIRSSVLTKRPSGYYRKIITTNGILYNYSPPSPDFDYGITDT
jgi:hypothetical protein